MYNHSLLSFFFSRSIAHLGFSFSFWVLRFRFRFSLYSSIAESDQSLAGFCFFFRDLMDEMVGPKGLIKKSEFIRIIMEALISLRFGDIAADLETKSGVLNTKKFLELVNNQQWEQRIDTPKRIKLSDEEQQFPPGVIIPEKRLESLLENILCLQCAECDLHNIPDCDLSLCFDHLPCAERSIPSKTVQILGEHTDAVLFLTFSHNGKYLASSSTDKSAILWEIDANGKFSLKHKLVGHKEPVVKVVWSPDDQHVITCGEKEVIRRWNVGSGHCVQLYEIHDVGSISCGLSHNGLGIIGAMTDRHLYLWRLDGTLVDREPDQHAHRFTDVAMTTDGKWFVNDGWKKHAISLYDKETKSETMIEEIDEISSFSLSKDNKYLLVVLMSHEIKLWNIEDNPRRVMGFAGCKRGRFTIKSCFGGYKENFIASGSETTQVYIWHRGQGRKPCSVLHGHTGAVNCVSWNPDDIHMLASASDDGTIRIWEPHFKHSRTRKHLVDYMDGTLGSKGLLKKSEFIRLIIEALYSLGFADTAASLEKESGVPLLNLDIKQFLELVKNGEWDKSIDALKKIQLRDEKAARFLLLEQKVLELHKNNNGEGALKTLTEQMKPLGVNTKRVHKLADKLAQGPLGEETESVNSGVAKKLQKLFPPAAIVPEKRLEYLLEKILDRHMIGCDIHNVPDRDLSLCSDHYCGKQKLPSETVQILEDHTDKVLFLTFSHNGKYLASSSTDKSAILWEMDAEGKFLLKHKLVGHKEPVVKVLWSPDDQQVITCGEVIVRWDVGSGHSVQLCESYDVGSVSCGWLHDGSGIIGAMADGHIYFWSSDGTELDHLQAVERTEVAMTTDGKWLVIMDQELQAISLFDIETRAETLIQEDAIIVSFSVSKDNKYLLIDLNTNEIKLWNIEVEPYKVMGFNGHKDNRKTIKSCFGGYEESFIACGSVTSQVYIWYMLEGSEPCCVLSGHSGSVNCVSWNPVDMHMLASASDDGTIRIWGLKRRRSDSMVT